MAKLKKEVWLEPIVIEYIDNNYDGKYSDFCRIAVDEKIKKESYNNEK